MKRILSIIFVLLFCFSVFAAPPTPPVTGLTSASNVAITGGTITNTTISGSTVNSVVSGWNQITAFTATPASTSTLTMTSDLSATIKPGYPLKYTIGGVTYYGYCTAITSNLLTVAGAPLGGSVTALSYGDPTRVTQIQAQIPSTYEDASNTALIASDLKTSFIWSKSTEYLVQYSVYSYTADGSGDGKASVRINDTEVNTSAGGLTIAAATTWYSTIVNIDSAAYDINYGESLEVTAVKGTGGDATYLTVKMIFVKP